MESKFGAVVLLTSDLERARSFYGQGLGFQELRGGADLAVYQLPGAGGLALMRQETASKLTGLVLGDPPDMPSQFLSLQADSNDAVDAFVAKAEAAGARVLRAPGDNDWGGYSAAFADPDGNAWTIGFNVELFKR